ncbi:MAG: protoporphyrinogen oxidase, partial [Acidimicrobiales bacterium]
RLVDPLIGGINAGGVVDLSAAATFPGLIAASMQSGSLMRQLRRARRPSPPTGGSESPTFWSLRQGTASLADRLVNRLVDPDAPWQVSLHTRMSVDAIDRISEPSAGSAGRGDAGTRAGAWSLALRRSGSVSGAGGHLNEKLVVDGIILAVSAPCGAVLLAAQAPEAAEQLTTIEYASVCAITLEFPSHAIGHPLDGTGFLVPRTSVIAGQPALMTGCTFLSRKWPHLAKAGHELMRVSVGRYGDERHRRLDDHELVEAARFELAHLLNVEGNPSDSLVTRWEGAFPQYRVGHLIRVARIDEAVSALPAVAVAGAAYRGVGIPACIGSGRDAARAVLRSLEAHR